MSSCPSAKVYPSLTSNFRGFFGRGDMQKEFEEAAFKLEKGQVSHIVETASGVHLIQRWVSVLIPSQTKPNRSSLGWNNEFGPVHGVHGVFTERSILAELYGGRCV